MWFKLSFAYNRHSFILQAHQSAKDYTDSCPLYHDLVILVPGDAEGTRAFHGQLVMQSQATTSSAPSSQTVTVIGEQGQHKQDDCAEDLSPVGMALDSGDMDQGSLHEGGGTGSGI